LGDRASIETPNAVTVDRRDDDPRLAFIYREAARGLAQQQGLAESFANRAGSLIFATAFASSLLGGNALADGLGIWEWLALALLLGIGVLIVLMLWPYYDYRFRLDPVALLDEFGDGRASMVEMHRVLALRLETYRAGNWRILQRLRLSLQIALILFILEIFAWLFAIGSS
jgi:hypothetical protein